MTVRDIVLAVKTALGLNATDKPTHETMRMRVGGRCGGCGIVEVRQAAMGVGPAWCGDSRNHRKLRLYFCPKMDFIALNQKKTGMDWQDRIDSYVEKTGFPRSLFIAEDGRVVGTWIMGNDYRVKSTYYGGYPTGYLKRVKALFPDKKRVLHLFSGKVDLTTLPGDTVDINPELSPTYLDDAQKLLMVPLEGYDLVLADPPYSIEDARRYQTTMIKRNAVLKALVRLPAGAHVVWLDQVLPMYRKDHWAIDAVIGMVKSTNHRFRVATVFQRLAD